MRRIVIALTTVALAFGGTMFVAAPAQAHPDCNEPWVCLWNVATDPDRRRQFQDFGLQNLRNYNAQNTIDHVTNTRNNDIVLLWDYRPNPDRAFCVPPNRHRGLGQMSYPGGGSWGNRVDAIDIRNDSTCPDWADTN